MSKTIRNFKGEVVTCAFFRKHKNEMHKRDQNKRRYNRQQATGVHAELFLNENHDDTARSS